jgi:hydrogenase/urease accessory protein HupE
MKTHSMTIRVLTMFAAIIPSVALAHPGHDGGHDLTWDFVGEVIHYLTSPYHLVPVVAFGAVGGAWLCMRNRKTARAKQHHKDDTQA